MGVVLDDGAVQALPASLRRLLGEQCGGEWDRVTRDDDGGYTVHNNPLLAQIRANGPVRAPLAAPRSAPRPVAPEPKAPARPRPQPPARRVVQARPRSAESAVLNEMVQSRRSDTIKPGLRIVQDPSEKIEPEVEQWSFDPQHVDWALVDLDTTAGQLRDRLQNGLPDEIPFSYHPDVLAVQGMDFDLVEAALRHPERVNVQPETAEKKYPILAFWRGDIVTILGMRTPTHPRIIAAYAVSRMDPELGRVRQVGSVGGGGARKRSGLPNSTRAMLKAIHDLGVEVQDMDPTAKTAQAVYKGQVLGKVSIGTAPKDQVHSDYQRVLRKVTAIDNRS